MTKAGVSVELSDSGQQNAQALPLHWETLLFPVQSSPHFLCISGYGDEWQEAGFGAK